MLGLRGEVLSTRGSTGGDHGQSAGQSSGLFQGLGSSLFLVGLASVRLDLSSFLVACPREHMGSILTTASTAGYIVSVSEKPWLLSRPPHGRSHCHNAARSLKVYDRTHAFREGRHLACPEAAFCPSVYGPALSSSEWWSCFYSIGSCCRLPWDSAELDQQGDVLFFF